MDKDIEIKPYYEYEQMSKIWYNSEPVAFEIIKTLKYRESVFIAINRKATHRCLKINAVRFLYKNMSAFDFFTEDYLFNVYYSLGHFPELPMFSYKWSDKQEQMSKFNLNFEDCMKGYDLFIDIDNPNLKSAHECTKKIRDIFRDYKIKFHLKFSGSKGWHIIIEYQNLPQKIKALSWEKMAKLFKLFIYELKQQYQLKDIDTTIYDLRRICKAPYTVVYPFYYVAMPLSDEEFDNFNLEDYHIKNMVNKVQSIKNRGLLTRQGEPDNLLRLMKAVSDKTFKKYRLFTKIMKIRDRFNYEEYFGDDING